jgi:hypothetical protein
MGVVVEMEIQHIRSHYSLIRFHALVLLFLDQLENESE